MVLVLREHNLKEIAEHSRSSFPVEACGILVGRKENDEKIVEKVYRARNILASQSRYQIDPEELWKVFDETERESKEVIGFYHSHPHWSASVSEIDRSLAFYPNCSYVVYSNSNDEAKSYLWNGEEFEEERVKIV